MEAFSDQPSIENVNLVQKQFSVLREKQRTALALALIRLNMGKAKEGKAIMDGLDSFEPDPWSIKVVGEVRSILDRQAARTAEAAASATKKQMVTGALSDRFVAYPSVELPE